jgi:hypothetical protein
VATANVGNLYRHRTFCYSGDQVGINVRYFVVAAVVGTPQNEINLIQVMDLALSARYIPALWNVAEYVGSDIQNITAAPPYAIQVGTSANQAVGTGGALPQASQVSGIFTTRSALTGRANRGRSYIPFPSASAATLTTPPEMTVAYQGLLLAIASQVTGATTAVVGAGTYTLQWVLCKNPQASIPKTTVNLDTIFVGESFATQKRRGDFGRTNPFPGP